MVLDMGERGAHRRRWVPGAADSDQVHAGALAQGEQRGPARGLQEVGAQHREPGGGQGEDPGADDVQDGRAFFAPVPRQFGRLAEVGADVEGKREHRAILEAARAADEDRLATEHMYTGCRQTLPADSGLELVPGSRRSNRAES
ncbi:hypothetical protein [Streptomyces sp. NPDC052107]|uniref:hypothetical protein n=1 Tax=Streptomyces sp. NPDC052107 TaxID=3155632 RepID=UPI0034426860